MATIRRLNPEDVKQVFDSLKHNQMPCESLKYSIVVVGSNGMKLSPPSYEFQGKSRDDCFGWESYCIHFQLTMRLINLLRWAVRSFETTEEN